MCQVGFTDKGFRCICREGYKVKGCDKGISMFCIRNIMDTAFLLSYVDVTSNVVRSIY